MMKNIVKFWAELMAVVLAFAGTSALGAITTQEAFEAAVTEAASGATIELDQGTFDLNSIAVKSGKNMTFVGRGADKTTLEYGHAYTPGASDWGGVSCYSFSDSGLITFKSVTLKDVGDKSQNESGFAGNGGLRLEDCTITKQIGHWSAGDVYCKNCVFSGEGNDKDGYLAVFWAGKSYVFEHCQFGVAGNTYKGCVQVYREDSSGNPIPASFRDCTFCKGNQTTKTPVYFYNVVGNGGVWDITVEGATNDPSSPYDKNATSGSWLWGDVRGNSTITKLTVNGATVWADGKMVTPDVEDFKETTSIATVSDKAVASALTPEEGSEAVTEAQKTAVKAVLENEAVAAATSVAEKTTTSEVVAALKSAASSTNKDKVTDSSEISTFVNVSLAAAETKTVAEQTVVKAMTFEVKPIAMTVVEGEVVSAVIPNAAITEAIVFRLPVDANATETKADVFHNGDKMGTYDVATVNDAKYIEVASATFSTFSYTLKEGGEEPPAGVTLALSGSGTADAPYRIENCADMQNFRDWVNAGNTGSGIYFELTADIDLSGEANWTPIGTFAGTFDGKGKTIANLTIAIESDDNIGLFNTLEAGSNVKNLNFASAKVSGTYVGILCGLGKEGATVQDIRFDSTCSVTATKYAAAAAMEFYGTLSRVVNHAPVTTTGDRPAAGIAAWTESPAQILYCTNTAKIVAGGWGAGGITANATGSRIEGCVNVGDVSTLDESGEAPAGGIVCRCSNATVSHCLNLGNVSTRSSNANSTAGGILGLVSGGSGSVSYCENRGNVSAECREASGIASSLYGTTISYCLNVGEVSSPTCSAGGVSAKPAYGTSSCSKCVNVGSVSGAPADNTYELSQSPSDSYYYSGDALLKNDGTSTTSADALAILNGGTDTTFFKLGADGKLTSVLEYVPEQPMAKPVAEIVETSEKFETLKEALAAVKSGETIRLLADFEDIGTVTLPAGVTIDGLDGETKHTISGASGFYIPEAGGCAIKNTQFVNLHDNSAWSDSDISSYGEDCGVSAGHVGKQSAIYATPLSGELEIRGCYFDNIDWDAIQITGVQFENDATIKIIDNEFRHTNATTAQLRYIHIESTSIFDTRPTILITDNRFYNTKYSHPIANIGIWNVEVEEGVNTVTLSGNWFENINNVVISLPYGSSYLYPARSQADVDVDDLVVVAEISNSDSTKKIQFGTIEDAVAAANQMGEEWLDSDEIRIMVMQDCIVTVPLLIDNVNGFQIRIASANNRLTAAGCDLFHVQTPAFLYGSFVCTDAAKYVADAKEGVRVQMTCPSGKLTQGQFRGDGVVVVGSSGGLFDHDVNALIGWTALNRFMAIEQETGEWKLSAGKDADWKAKGFKLKVSSAMIANISSTRYFKTLTEIVENTDSNSGITLIDNVTLAEGEGLVREGKTITLDKYTIGGPVESEKGLTIKNSSSTPNQTFDFIKTTDAGLILGSGAKYNTEAVVKDADIGTMLMIYRSFKKVTIEGGRYKSPEKVATLYTYSSEKPELVVKGGVFGSDQVYDNTGKVYLPLSDFVPEGYEVVANPDEATKATYPWKVQEKAAYVAYIGAQGYETLDAAIKAAAAMDQAEEKVIELQSCEITESIKLPATLKNVTFRGQEDGTSVLKDMTINSSDGSAYTYENIWFDGVVFENSMVIVTGARTGIEVNKNWKFTGNTFRNLTQQGYSYLHFASLSAEEPAENFTFTGNVVDGSTFASAAALNISSVTGTIAFNDNDIKNLLWRPMNIQINNHDGVADTLTVTGNKFGICGSMPQMLTRFEDGYDPLRVRINQNVFGGNVATGFALGIDNPETLDGDVTHNYYSSATTRIYVPNDYVYFDSDSATDLPHADNTCFSYYTGLTEDGEIDPATLVEVKKVAVAKIGETTYPTLAAAVEAVKAGWTVTLVADCGETVTGGSVPFVLEKGGKSFTGAIVPAEGYTTVASPIAGDDSVRYMPVDEEPIITATMTKVTSGFYQSGANYGASTGFYITSKAGLEYFRDIINNLNGEAAAYRDSAAGAGFDLSAHRFSGKTINLLADVDLDNEVWTPIGRATDRDMLAGTFDGNNHVVSNLKTVYTTEGKDQAGFFGYSNKAFAIKNLTLRNVDIKGFTYVGALISTASKADSEIVNCHVVGSVSITAVSSYVGGIVGHGNCPVSNCSVEATGGTGISVTGGGICVGGIYGYAANAPGDITDCSVSGLSISLAQNYVAGGIVGGVDRPLTVSGCSVEDVTIECQRGPYLGYVVGSIQGGDGILAITDCTVANSTLLSHVDKYTEKEETYLVQCGAHDAPTCYYVGSNVETDGNGKVVGGTFEWLPDGLVATGYEKVAQGTTPETWVVQEKPAPVVPIAEIVGKEGAYTSLDDAILAAGANDVIRMLADADVGDVMGAYRSQKGYAYKLPGNLTIDLGNHEVKLGSVALYESDDGGKLLFENGKININGAMGVAMEANDAASVFYVGKQGTLEFNAVEIVGTDVAASVVFRTYTLNAPLMRFDGCTISIDGCNDFVHAIQRVEFEDTQVQIKNNRGRVFRDNDGHTNDGGSRVTLLRSSVSVDGISGNGGEDVNAIVLDASSLSFKNYQTESMGANKCNIELKNGSSFVLDGVGSHGFTNGKLVVNPGCTVDVKNVAYLGLNVTDGSIFKAGSKVSVSNCCTTDNAGKSAYLNQDIAMWSSGGSVVIESGADVKIDGRLIVKSGSLSVAGGQYKKVELENGTLSLTGGVYVKRPDDSYAAEGYEVQANADPFTKDGYPWAVAEKAFVPAKEKEEDEKPAVIEINIKQTEKQAETPEMVPVAMSAEAVAKMVESGIIETTNPEQPKASEVMTGLAKTQDNQQTVWQNYVMGVDGTDTKNVIATIGEKTADKPKDVVVVKTPIKAFNPPQNTGVTVTYRLMKSLDGKTWEVYRDGLAKPEFDVDTSKLELGDTLWKIEAVFSAEKPKAN